MKYIRYILLCFVTLALSACAAVEKVKKTFTPTPDPAETVLYQSFVERLARDIALPLMLLCSLFICSCNVFPTMRDPETGMIVTLGASALTKSKAENRSATYKGVALRYSSLGNDETGVPGALIGSKTTLGLADAALNGLRTTEKTTRHLDDNRTTETLRAADSTDLKTTTDAAVKLAPKE